MEIPENFAPPEAWPEFGSIAYPPPVCKRAYIGTNPKGVRWCLWPLCFERYYGDTEPDMQVSNKEDYLRYNRLVVWSRVRRSDVPRGWHESRKKSWRADGYHDLRKDTGDYTERWDKDTRRNLREWRQKLLGTAYIIEEISLEEFIASHKKSITAKKIGSDQLQNVVRKYALPETRPHMVLWGVRNCKTKEIIAGTAAFFSPTHKSSVRESPFMLFEARKAHAMTGLMDHWFAESKKRGIELLVFTHFWQPGEPKKWKGFSNFKLHFDLQTVSYPPALWRFVRGRFL